MADKPFREESPLAAGIRRAAKRAGGLEELRELTGLSTGTFYGILAGSKAQRNPTSATLRKLARAGVKVPDPFRNAA